MEMFAQLLVKKSAKKSKIEEEYLEDVKALTEIMRKQLV